MRAGAEDLAALRKLEVVCFPDPWSEAVLSQTLSSEKYVVLLQRDENGEPVSYLIGSHFEEEAELDRIAVLHQARGQGRGRKLLEEALQHWQHLKVERVFLEVRASNQVALSLYLSSGFETVATRRNYYSDGEDALVLRRDLQQPPNH